MKRKIVSTLLGVLLCLNLAVPALAVEANTNFTKQYTYAGQFTDVEIADWYFNYVKDAYEFGLIKGSSDTAFSPDGNLTIAETITLAVRLHSIYMYGTAPNLSASEGGNWYDPFVDYALENNTIPEEYEDYNALATRYEVAEIFAKAVPNEALAQMREVADGFIPDVSETDAFADAVYTLYRAGVLSGSDEAGTFYPYSNIKRSEISAICVRIVNPDQRLTQPLGQTVSVMEEDNNTDEVSDVVLTAEEIAQQCAPAVFYIESYGFNGAEYASGSGFFISADGIALTNHHVVANSSYLEIKAQDGTIYDDVEIIAADKENDLALLRVKGKDFTYLNMGNSDTLKQGKVVYAIGSPLGLENTMSQGIVSNANRELEDMTYVQISVPIDHGSSGGALIAQNGTVVGITSAGFEDTSADLNLAIPINKAKGLENKTLTSDVVYSDVYYSTFHQVLDFGYFSGVKVMSSYWTTLGYEMEYDIWDFYDVADKTQADCYEETMYYYYLALLEQGFTRTEKSGVYGGRFETDTEILWIEYDMDEGVIRVNPELVPQFYSEYSALPDFGWFMDLELNGEPEEYRNSTVYVYLWTDVHEENHFSNLLYYYFRLLEDSGFEYISYEYEDNADIYNYEGNGLSVKLTWDSRAFFVDVLEV